MRPAPATAAAPATRARPGFTLVEVMVACVVLAIFGATALRLFTTQVRFVDQEQKVRAARAVGRQSYALLVSEMRMVEASGGVVDAGTSAVTLRVPYALGVLCETQPGGSVVSVLPTDAYGNAVASGYAWRDALGTYTYDETPGYLTAPADSSACVANGVGTPPGGSVVRVTPALAPSVPVAGTVFLYQRVRYEFAPSTTYPGRRALWRTVQSTNVPEELAAPFDTTATFRYYGLYADTSVAMLPLSSIRGVDLLLAGASERPRWGRATPEVVPFHTSVFFANRQ